MDAKIKQILNIVVVILVVVWLLNTFGILSRAQQIRVSTTSHVSNWGYWG
jgi:hypothetical protein